MADEWILTETETLDLGDKRLNERFREVLGCVSARPSAGIPEACGGWTETTAAYRLFDNEKASFKRILEPHADAVRSRMSSQPTVMLIQDTTEIDLTRPSKQVKGAGTLDGGGRRGMFLHALLAATPDGTPLGTLDAKVWARDPESAPSGKKKTRGQRAGTPIEEKESFRWVEMQETVAREAQALPDTRVVGLCDSEADVYEVMAAGSECEWIVRSCQDRALLPETKEEEESSAAYLRARLLEQPVVYWERLGIRSRDQKISCETRTRRLGRDARKAEVSVRAARVALRPPKRPGKKLPPIEVNAVLVLEENPPEGEEAVEWLLLTTLPIDSEDNVREIVEFYCVRWIIEIFFRVLKSGCRVEDRRFETLDRFQSCLALYLIVAWRTLYVCRLARSCPDLPCDAVFEKSEWCAAWTVVRGEPPPERPPPLAEMVEMVAELGGYLKRKHSPPGPQTVWIGLQRVRDFAICWSTFGPGAG